MSTLNAVPCTLLFSAFLLTPIGAAQAPVPEIHLGPAERALQHQFTQLRAVRELPDGRLLVTDRLEPAIYAVVWNGSRLTRIGREGEGPRGEPIPPATYYFTS